MFVQRTTQIQTSSHVPSPPLHQPSSNSPFDKDSVISPPDITLYADLPLGLSIPIARLLRESRLARARNQTRVG